jgi:hypothetical protein
MSLALCGFARPLAAVDLKSHTVEAFDAYIHAAESEIARRVRGGRSFLWLEEADNRKTQARTGQVVIGSPSKESMIEIRDGMIHHWVGSSFLKGVGLSRVLSLLQDYDNHKRFYAPEVTDSKLINRNGNDFRIFLRLRKEKVVTVVLNTEHDARFMQLDKGRWHTRSYSTRIAEVENAGERDEREKPPGRDNGFLWRLYTYWRLVEQDGGVYIECEAISLTRDIPTGLGWLVKPVVSDLPRESLEATMRHTARALVGSAGGQAGALP